MHYLTAVISGCQERFDFGMAFDSPAKGCGLSIVVPKTLSGRNSRDTAKPEQLLSRMSGNIR
jgi:hypothetical protein